MESQLGDLTLQAGKKEAEVVLVAIAVKKQ